jgi:hypothetical protein
LVPELQDQNPVTIDTLASGSVVSDSAQIPVQLIYSASFKQDNKTPDSMQIKLLAADGTEIRTFAIGADALASQDKFSIDLPSLDTGLYTLNLTVLKGGKVLQEKQVQFFHVKGSYSVSGISTYPSTFYPGSSGLLQAHVDVPSGADPYLRWTMNDKTFAEGRLSGGLDQVMFRAPETDGAYNVTVELFPMAPVSSTGFPFSSSIKQTTEVFVSKTKTAGSAHELGPAESYYSLFHFRGDYRDVGYRVGMKNGGAAPAVQVGQPDLRISGSIFGYHLDGSSGFRVADVILPFAGNRLSPFSLTMRAMADRPELNRNIFSATSTDGSFHFAVRTDSDGIVVADLTDNGQSVTISSGQAIFVSGDPVLFSVSVSPGVNSTQFLWFKNGQPVSVATASVAFRAVDTANNSWTPVPGVSLIGAPDRNGTSDGFSGILDEFGVYFRDSSLRPATDNAIFETVMATKYGTALVYAKGFEGLYLPDGVETTGPVAVKSGDLVLGPGGAITFPRFLFDREDLLVEVALDRSAPAGPGDIRFSALGTGTSDGPIFSLATDGTVRVPQSLLVGLKRDGRPVSLASLRIDQTGSYVVPLSTPIADPLDLQFVHEASTLVVDVQNNAYTLQIANAAFAGLQMSLAHGAGEVVPFRVRSVLARKESGSLTETLNSVIPSQP